MAIYTRDLAANTNSRSVWRNGKEYVLEISSTIGHTDNNPPWTPAPDYTVISIYPVIMEFEIDNSKVITDSTGLHFFGVRDKRVK